MADQITTTFLVKEANGSRTEVRVLGVGQEATNVILEEYPSGGYYKAPTTIICMGFNRGNKYFPMRDTLGMAKLNKQKKNKDG